MGGRAIHDKLLDYFQQHPNETLSVTRIAKETGEPHKRIQSWVTSVRNRNMDLGGGRMEIVMRGRIYRYVTGGDAVGSGPGGKRMFQEVGTTKEGDVILECEDGTLYKAAEL